MLRRKGFAMIAMACGIVGFAGIGCEYTRDAYGDPEGDSEQLAMKDTPVLSENTPLPAAGEALPNQVIALSQPTTETMDWLNVSSSAFGHNQNIADRFTGYGNGDLPPLKWSDVPKGVQSFVVIVEDPDALNPRPYTHLILYNIPGNQNGIGSKDLEFAQANNASGTALGRNSSGTLGYVAPMPPAGEGAHTYHFQVFALDSAMNLPAGAEKQDVINAMKGHVLAKGETIGTFQRQ